MAITDKKKGVWGLDQTYNKINQGSIWDYSGIFTFYGWGNNQYGQLGQNNTVKYSSPVQIPGTTWNASTIQAYEHHVGVIKTDGTLWMWGYNDGAQLGQNNKTSYSSPVQVGGDTTWSKLTESSTSWQSGAIKTDGTLWLWGGGASGELAQNSRTRYSSPVQVPAGDTGVTWDMASQNEDSCLAIKTNGELWAWGNNSSGLLGQNQAYAQLEKVSSPIQIPGTTWKRVAGSGYYQATAIKTDGTLWTWGANDSPGYGQLGHNNNVAYSSPTQVPGTWDTGADKFTAQRKLTAGIKTDGTLWIWGLNAQGQLGQNSVIHYSSPVQVPGTTWDKVGSAWYTTFAQKTDGTLWAWGENANGEYGLNNTTKYSSPIQIPGSWPSFITAGEHNVFATASV